MDVSQYLEIFIEESREHLQSLNEQLLILEKEPDNQDTINEIFRAAHSLKGMAGTMGYKRMQKLTHDMENIFSEIRSGNMKVGADLMDALFKGLDALESYLDNIINNADEGTNDNQELIDQFDRILKAGLTDKGGATDNTKEPSESQQDTANVAAQAKTAVADVAFKEIKLSDADQDAINKAIEGGLKAYGVTVYVQESCILKAARAFLVFKALEECGDVIKSVPEVQDIEDERFDMDFSLILITKFDAEKIKSAILNVSEIKDAALIEYEATKEEKPADAADNPGNSEAAQKAKSTETKTGTQQQSTTKSKPVVNRSVRVDIEKLDDLMNLVSELIIAKNGLVSINSPDQTEERKSGNFNEQVEYLERVTTNIHTSVMKVRMVPIESVVNRFPRMIRDLSKKLNKRMELFMTGEDTELDRTVIDEIGDPLQHLLRNAADHGLESNEDRIAAGKPEVGSIELNAYQEGNNVVIEVKDDGAGINVEKVKAKAINKGVITEEQAETMTDKEIIDILFRPSFSTAEVISDVSGRGVGLDVVKTKIEALGGNIEAKTALGEGSTFIIRLPLTLAIIQALMVKLGDEQYAIPLGSIQTIEDVQLEDIKYVQAKEVINLRGTVVPLIRLDEILDVEKGEEQPESLTVVIVSKGEKQAGLVVDSLIGQLEIVIKSIGKYINNSKMISGATILGDGEIALILDVNTLV